MLTRAIVINFLMGCALIAIGLIPGLLDAIQEGIESFRGQFSRFPMAPRHDRRIVEAPLSRGQVYVAAGGVLLIALSVLAFFYR